MLAAPKNQTVQREGFTMTVADHAERWLLLQQGSKKPSTLKNYEARLHAYVLPIYGELHPSEITRENLITWLARLHKAKLQPNSIRCAWSVFHSLCEELVESGKLDSNPLNTVKKQVPKRPAPKGEPIEDDKLPEVLERIEKVAPHLKVGYLLQLLTGMRIAEVAALRWEDVDLASKVVRVRRNLSANSETSPKTKLSRRSLELSDDLVSELRAHGTRFGRGEYVLESREGGHYTTGHFIKVWSNACKYVGARRGTHALRHWYSHTMKKEGVDTHVLSRLLGHSNVRTTEEIYLQGWECAADDEKITAVSNRVFGKLAAPVE